MKSKITGEYNEAVIYGDITEINTVSQITDICNEFYLRNEKIRIMPDAHAGNGCTIGTTLTYSDKINPSFVSVDIGCGMHVDVLKDKTIDLEKLDYAIHNFIPSGRDINKKDFFSETSLLISDDMYSRLKCKDCINKERMQLSLGTLGGGNHFIEVDKDEEGTLYLVIHSGSRSLGYNIAEYYQNKAYEQCNSGRNDGLNFMIQRLKNSGRHKEISGAIKEYKASYKMIDKEKCYLSGKLMKDYLNDMRIACQYSDKSKEIMSTLILWFLDLESSNSFTTMHNYVDTNNKIIRKGAVDASAGVELLIPINMRDGSLLCIGKGNSEWNYSAPHGAGRVCSRTKAKELFSFNEYKDAMSDIYSSSVTLNTLDECPMAYKTMDYIERNIKETVDIKHILKPIYNFKAQ